MTESVVLAYEIASPITSVWHALIDSETLSRWMMFKTNTFRPEVGHTFQLLNAQGYDGVIDCEVTTLEAPHTLAYTWQTPGQDNLPHTTLVTFSLSETDTGGTRLQLEQSGFRAEARQELGGARYGWEYMIGELRSLLAAS